MTKGYYEQHKEERRAYQREYARKKFGYKAKENKEPKTEEQIKEERRKRAREYYWKNREKCMANSRKYYKENRDYFLEKSHERYQKICAEKYGYGGQQDD